MFRANIYSMGGGLAPEARGAIHDGVDMVAAYMGQTVVKKELSVRLPQNENGLVNPHRVGFAKLDKMVELHLMAVPVDRGETDVLGLAGMGRGWAFANISTDSAQVMRMTACHEISHAFGFVIPAAEQADQTSPGHCASRDCIMHKFALYNIVPVVSEPTATNPGRWDPLARWRNRNNGDTVDSIEVSYQKRYRQADFCSDCKVDMREHGDKNLARLRHRRIMVPTAGSL